MDNKSKNEIKRLKKEKQYEVIFQKYGRDAYLSNVSRKYQREDLKKLSKEGKYLDIYHRYGSLEYRKYLIKAKANEIKEAQGLGKAILYKTRAKLRDIGVKFGLFVSLGAPVFTVSMAMGTEDLINENRKLYEKEIEANDLEIAEYAKEVNEMHLENHTQVIMKVMDDMWERIEGYGTPRTYDEVGVLELALTGEDARGVCRHMATDNEKRINAINPKYNARTIAVYMGEDGISRVANIDRNIIENNNTVVEDEKEESKISEVNDQVSNLASKVFGNHMVTLLDIPDTDITLVMDPTNPSIGVYVDGKIVMLNPKTSESNDKKYAEMNAYEIATATTVRGGIDGIISSIKDLYESYDTKGKSIDEVVKELIDDFGLDAQNEALKVVREKKRELSAKEKGREMALEIIHEDNMKREAEEKEIQDAFENRIKVNLTNEQKAILNSKEGIDVKNKDDEIER